ncbi:hypothetical protein C7N43_18055 [Sphingobacteriales bacterium UPWRP_1]|nr:hypothetical protein C7N43_18055 [Sphingobacteriales bacterium UPWRP_1]
MNELILTTKAELTELINACLDTKLKEYKPEPPPVIVANDLPELLTRKQAAELLNISLVTLDTHTNAGKIPVQRIGHRKLYRKQDIFNALQKVKN